MFTLKIRDPKNKMEGRALPDVKSYCSMNALQDSVLQTHEYTDQLNSEEIGPCI